MIPVLEAFRSWMAMKEINSEKTNEAMQPSIRDAKATENGLVEHWDSEIPTYDEAKDYAMNQWPIVLPKRFLRGRAYRCQRIESLAARFIYRPTVPWPGPLDDWRRELLTKCFGLEIFQLPNGWYCANKMQMPIPYWMINGAEFLEELWEFEHETATEYIEAVKLCRRSRKGSIPDCTADEIEKLKQKKYALAQRLCAIVAHEWLIIEYMAWPDAWMNNATRLLIFTRYRDSEEAWWVEFMKRLCKLHEVPRWVLKERMANALVGFTKGDRWGFPKIVLDQFAVDDEAETEV